jgi:hypothetical protein
MEEATTEEATDPEEPGVTNFTIYIPDFLQEYRQPLRTAVPAATEQQAFTKGLVDC